ncbi:MAG TPA: polysaccharide deacetylase family protein [Actinomycetota bacterium]
MTIRARIVLVLWLAASVVPACSPAGRQASPSPSRPPTSLPSTTASTPTAVPASLTPPPAGSLVLPRTVTGSAVVVARGSPARRTVFLTFDAGSDTGFAAQILDTLKAAGVSATFGITGRWAEQNAPLVRRIVAEGHSIVNHTYDHRSFTGVSSHAAPLSPGDRIAEIAHADQVLTGLAGHPVKPWFRLPYGDGDHNVDAQVLQAGYRYVLGWTVDSLGWQGLSAPAISTRCLSRAAPGVIYLFHVGSQSQDAVALPGMIQSLKDQGYGFDTVADLGA